MMALGTSGRPKLAGRGMRLMIGLLLWPGLLVALTAEECSTAQGAHEKLLESSFEVERTFRMTVNDDLKKREVSLLSYSAGELETEVLEDEVHSKILVFDTEDEDFVLELPFACERLVEPAPGRYELTSEDGLEVAEFELDVEAGALRPVAWRLDTTARFLFKKLVMAGRVEYSGFEWK